MGQRFGGSSFLEVALDRFSSAELLEFVLRWKIDLDEVKSLKRTSAMIQSLCDEAEMKQFTDVAVKLWLDDVVQLLYDAEDILDEYATEILRLKLESKSHQQIHHHHQTQQQYGGTESADKGINDTSEGIDQPKVFNMAEELQGIKRFRSKVRDINDELKNEAQEGVALGLMKNFNVGSGSSRSKAYSERPPTSSVVNSSIVFGRDDDKWKIIDWLLSNKSASPSNSGDNFAVLPIVGMGGAGKTTLAQLVYNDEKVDKYFQLKAWVCISEDFDVMRLTKEILDSATKSSSPPANSLDVLQVKLKEALSNKRFLLVLDDMWNKDYDKWDALTTPFAFGKLGSKILVTTRDKGITSMVHTVENDHDLKGLSDDDCFALVRRHAFMDGGNSSKANQKMELFGQEIVKKCKGLPLAVKTLASLLRDKMENSEWEDILENEIWDLKEGKILPSLMLSYHHLPPLLKRCFAYCALFPKDYAFDKIFLVTLWMAEGIIQPKGKKRVEDIGAGYFDELLMRSFFELSDHCSFSKCRRYDTDDIYFHSNISGTGFMKLSNEIRIKSFFQSSSNTGSRYVMHDLIHDLAEFVMDGVYCRSEVYDKPSKVVTTTRHLSYLKIKFNFEATKFEAIDKGLRTLLDLKFINLGCHETQFLPTMQFQFQFLRVLRFRGCTNRELPDSIGQLKHLRLLDLSYSDKLVKLPNSTTSLYNLQTLILTCCWSLKEFPEDMGNLVNLRHLFLPIHPFDGGSIEMSLEVGNFTRLQTLNIFIVGSKSSCNFMDLPQQLRGSLEISKLENVGNSGTTAITANLKNNPHLLGLRLSWSRYKSKEKFSELGRDEKREEDVLHQLQPHTNLEALWIENYGGMRFPSWIEHPSFSSLETVHLFNCRNCMFLPHLSKLPLLKNLLIHVCSAIKLMVGSELHGDGSSSANKKFQSLETLCIRYLEQWEEWPEVVEEDEGGGQFPHLRKLRIERCPKLTMFSHHFPKLVKLKIQDCNGLSELPRILPSLQRLYIYGCPKLVVLPSLPSIEVFFLRTCDQITTLFGSDYPSSSSPVAATTPSLRVDNSLHRLRQLLIENCPNLREITQTLPSLESLEIADCEEFYFLPMLPSVKGLRLRGYNRMEFKNKTMPHHLSSLSFLTIVAMSNLKSLPSGLMQHLISLQELSIYHCRELTVLLQNESGIDHDVLPSSLQHLCITDCDKLWKLPQSMCNLLCLKQLILDGTTGLTSLPEGLHNLTSLEEFHIQRCFALVSLPKTGLPTGLQRLKIIDCKNLEPLPMGLLHNLTSLQSLALGGFPNLNSLPDGLHKLTSLQILKLSRCPALESFPDMGLPTALRGLSIINCGKLNSLPRGLHNLTHLEELTIEECSFLMECKNLESLYNSGLHNLTTLQSLTIRGCPSLVYIPKGMLPTNLRSFNIYDCPILESLHDGLSYITSLEYLHIWKCPMLTQKYQEREGEEWSKIAYIPELWIDSGSSYPS